MMFGAGLDTIFHVANVTIMVDEMMGRVKGAGAFSENTRAPDFQEDLVPGPFSIAVERDDATVTPEPSAQRSS
jgi:hypothetical protein